MSRTYVDNPYNRRVGRVGLPVGSAVISKNTVCGINTKSYVDNDYNRRLGRVGLSHGSAVESKYSDGLTTWNYLDLDRQEGRQVCPQRVICSPTPITKYTEPSPCYLEDVENPFEESIKYDPHLPETPSSNAKSCCSRERWRSSDSSGDSCADIDKVARKVNATLVEEFINTLSAIDLMNQPQPNVQEALVQKIPRAYVDNPYNSSHGRVGLPVGSAVISKNTVCGINTKSYVDNDYNRRLGRVGLSHGSAVESKYSDGLTTWNYLDLDRQEGRQVCPQRVICSPTPITKYTEPSPCYLEDVKNPFEESIKYDLHLPMAKIPSGNAKSCRSRERWRSSDCSGDSSTDMDKVAREMNATLVEELIDTESTIALMNPPQPNVQEGDFHEIAKCFICHTDVECSSITPCGHHFCTHCIIQWLERKRTCPVCKTHLKETQLIRDEEFDRIAKYFGNSPHLTTNRSRSGRANEKDQYKQEIEQLKLKVQELQDNLNRQQSQSNGLQQHIVRKSKKCDVYEKELNKMKRSILPEKERLITQLQNQLEDQAAYTNGSRKEVQTFKDQMRQKESSIKKYERLCADKDEELNVLRNFIVPEREGIIIQLQRQNEKLAEKRSPNVLSEREKTAIKQLQTFYDRDLRPRCVISESMMQNLRDKTEAVTDMFSSRTVKDDGLVDLTRNYTSLIKENSNLHKTLTRLEDDLKRLKRELHHSKARTHESERRHTSERTLSEE